MEAVDGVIAFLSGRYREIERDLEDRMQQAPRPRRSTSRPRSSATA